MLRLQPVFEMDLLIDSLVSPSGDRPGYVCFGEGRS